MGVTMYVVLAAVTIIILVMITRKASKGINNISVQNVKDLLKENDLLILDVRSNEEFSAGHLKESRNVPVQSLSLQIASLLDWKNKKVLVYCHSGGRSLAASQMLKKSGFTKIYNMTGGVSAWVGAGNKLVK
jgi:rhodanese-related sulfurtransferase